MELGEGPGPGEQVPAGLKRGCTGGAGAGPLLTPWRERGKSCLSPGYGVLGPLS